MRTVVFGVDGLSFRVIDPLMKAGLLPNFEALTRDGARSMLESKFPPCTPPAWMSMVTGLKPAKHGVYDFWAYDQDGVDRLLTGRKGGKAIWNILSDYGKRVLVMNIPLTYPPEPVNGIFVSGFPGGNEKGEFTSPHAFREELLAHVPGYRVDLDDNAVRRHERTHEEESVDLITNRLALMRYLMREKEWDFAWVVYRLSDHLQHKRWPEIMALEPTVMRYYQLLDEALGEAREMAGPDGNLFVVSDHGFQGTRVSFAINEYLYRHGWLHTTQKHQRALRTFEAVTKRVLARVGLLSPVRRVKHFVTGRLSATTTEFSRQQHRMVPYLSREEANAAGVCMPSWSGTAGGYSIVRMTQPLSAERKAQLCRELLAIREPSTGQPLLDAIYPTEVFGTGPYAPDTECLLLLASDGITFTPILGKPWLWDYEEKLFGTHQKDGVLYACGPTIRGGGEVPHAEPFEVADVMPTVLRAMGLEVPEGLDGHVMEEIFLPVAPATPTPTTDTAPSLVARKLQQLQRR